MGGKMRIVGLIRKQAYYRPMLETLAQFGVSDYTIEAPTGRGHPMLIIHFREHKIRIPLPSSPNSHSDAPRYIPSEIRRRLREITG